MPNSDYYGYGVDGSHPYFNWEDPDDEQYGDDWGDDDDAGWLDRLAYDEMGEGDAE